MLFLKKITTTNLVRITNVFEYFELYIYIHLVVIINQKIFPHLSMDDILVKAFTFMGIYFFSPLARIYWGIRGDLQGRKTVLVKSAILTSVATFLIIFIPEANWFSQEYAIIPIIVLFVLRTFQSIGIAGEPLAAKLYSLEHIVGDIKNLPLSVTKMTMTQMAGGLLALGSAQIAINYITWEHAWRLPFVFAFLGSIFCLYIRISLSETEEYMTLPLKNSQVKLTSYLISEILQSLNFKNITFISFSVLSMSYPILFVFSYVFLSPLIVEKFGYHKEFIITYNFFVCLGEIIFTYIAVWLPTKLNWPKKTTMASYHLISAICIVLLVIGVVYKNFPMWGYICLQVALIVGVDWNLVYGSISKTFPITQRFTLMSIAGSLVSIFQFIIISFILPLWFNMRDIKTYATVCIIVLILASIMVFLYIPYEELAKRNMRRIQLKNR